jgi:hypothetical protein
MHSLEGMDKRAILAWCPPLLDSEVMLHESKLNLFSFGMAHKIQVKYYKKLRDLLIGHESDYSVWISTAFHEKANFGDFNSISAELKSVFGDQIQFMGFLSDEAVNYFLDKTKLFVAFFERGVRANNTSVYAAMRRGCAVLTNCDEFSPPWLSHGKNILDIHQISAEDLSSDALARIGEAAQEDAINFAGWKSLVELLNSNH